MSLKIRYESVDFPKVSRVTSGELICSWDELLWAAITIGRPNTYHVFRHGLASLHEAVFRVSLLRMTLQEGYGGHLERTSAIRSLDPTEKGMVSYFLGMVLCKLFAHRLLSTSWLLHLDVFQPILNPTILGRSRPDLVGEDVHGAWHAFECKGRSSNPSADDKEKAKQQASRLLAVDGKQCQLHVGSIAYFKSEKLQFFWCDPQPGDPEQIDLEVPNHAWKSYYEFALALTSDGGMLGYDIDSGGHLDVKVEIHPFVLSSLVNGNWLEGRERAKEIGEELRLQGYQPDGIRVVAGSSWSTMGY